MGLVQVQLDKLSTPQVIVPLNRLEGINECCFRKDPSNRCAVVAGLHCFKFVFRVRVRVEVWVWVCDWFRLDRLLQLSKAERVIVRVRVRARAMVGVRARVRVRVRARVRVRIRARPMVGVRLG